MLSLSKELSQAVLNYLIGQWELAKFRDYLVGMRLESYDKISDLDKAFLNEFEGRYAEFSDFGEDEQFLRKSLIGYIFADDASAIPQSDSTSFFVLCNPSSGSLSINLGAGSRTRNLFPILSPA